MSNKHLNKRSRGSNFNKIEEDILVECALKHKNVLENKKSDAVSIQIKAKAWEDISRDFNSQCPNDVVSFIHLHS